jgi:sugar/nucleoside kinase (ribokinase family)
LVLANLDEAAELTGTREPRRAADALGRMFRGAVIKLGSRGEIFSDGRSLEREAAKQIQLIDSTGAGDAFAAGVITALLDGGEPRELLAAGNEFGAQACVQVGSRPVRAPRRAATTQ